MLYDDWRERELVVWEVRGEVMLAVRTEKRGVWNDSGQDQYSLMYDERLKCDYGWETDFSKDVQGEKGDSRI
jgi:hypothetical protein